VSAAGMVYRKLMPTSATDDRRITYLTLILHCR